MYVWNDVQAFVKSIWILILLPKKNLENLNFQQPIWNPILSAHAVDIWRSCETEFLSEKNAIGQHFRLIESKIHSNALKYLKIELYVMSIAGHGGLKSKNMHYKLIDK